METIKDDNKDLGKLSKEIYEGWVTMWEMFPEPPKVTSDITIETLIIWMKTVMQWKEAWRHLSRTT
jgi:cytochrome c551/c552